MHSFNAQVASFSFLTHNVSYLKSHPLQFDHCMHKRHLTQREKERNDKKSIELSLSLSLSSILLARYTEEGRKRERERERENMERTEGKIEKGNRTVAM